MSSFTKSRLPFCVEMCRGASPLVASAASMVGRRERFGAPFPPPLVKLLLAQRFRDPAPVQAATWPLVMMGRDVLAVAKTG